MRLCEQHHSWPKLIKHQGCLRYLTSIGKPNGRVLHPLHSVAIVRGTHTDPAGYEFVYSTHISCKAERQPTNRAILSIVAKTSIITSLLTECLIYPPRMSLASHRWCRGTCLSFALPRTHCDICAISLWCGEAVSIVRRIYVGSKYSVDTDLVVRYRDALAHICFGESKSKPARTCFTTSARAAGIHIRGNTWIGSRTVVCTV